MTDYADTEVHINVGTDRFHCSAQCAGWPRSREKQTLAEAVAADRWACGSCVPTDIEMAAWRLRYPGEEPVPGGGVSDD